MPTRIYECLKAADFFAIALFDSCNFDNFTIAGIAPGGFEVKENELNILW